MGVENDEEFFVKPPEGSRTEVDLPQSGTDGFEPDELRHLFRFRPNAGTSEDLLCERGTQSESEGRRATCCARSSPLSWYGPSWCVISVLLSDGFIVPDLTGAEHCMDSTGEATSGSDSGNLPAETLSDLFVGL